MEETPNTTKDKYFLPSETKIPKKKIQLMDQTQAHLADKKLLATEAWQRF